MKVIPPVTGNALYGPLSIFCAQLDFSISRPFVDFPSRIVGSKEVLMFIEFLHPVIVYIVSILSTPSIFVIRSSMVSASTK